MSLPKSYENLSHAELIELVMARDAELAAKGKELAAKDNALAKATQELADKAQVIAQKTDEIAALHAKLAIFIDAVPTLREMIALASQNALGIFENESIWEQIRHELKQLVQDAKSAPLLSYLLKTGTEGLKLSKQVEECRVELEQAFARVEQFKRTTTEDLKAVSAGVEQINPDNLSPEDKNLYEDMKAINEVDAGEPAEPDKKPLKGRQKRPKDPNPRQYQAPGDFEPTCGHSKADYVEASEEIARQTCLVQKKLKTIQAKTHIRYFFCRKCHRVHVVVDPDAPLPVGPERSFSMDIAAASMKAVRNGSPLERFVKKDLEIPNVGHSSVFDQMHFAVTHTLKPMLIALRRSLYSQEVVEMDETPFSCLQMQGKGTGKPKDQDPDAPNTKPFIFACGTPHYCKQQVADYRTLVSRAAKSIYAAMPEDAAFDSIVVDGYTAYETIRGILEDSGRNIELQSCLVHARRYLVNAIGAKSWADALAKLDPQARKDFLTENGKKMTPQAILLQILEGFRKIFVIEGALKPQEGEDLQDYFARVYKVRQTKVVALMDAICRLVDRLAQGCAKQCKNGKWKKCNAAVPHAAFVVYFKNREQTLRSFLYNPKLVCHTNAVERQVRPVTIFRKNANFLQSKKGMDVLCDIMTLFETAERNGIDAVDWILAVHRYVFGECARMHAEKVLATRKGPGVRGLLKGWDWDSALEQIELPDYLMPWNFGKA